MSHLDDVKKYSNSVDEAVVSSMEKTYRLVLSKPDSAVVAYTDPAELETVKKNFINKKLGVSDDAAAGAAIAAVGKKLAGVNRKSRLTVYYLLAEELGKLDVFR